MNFIVLATCSVTIRTFYLVVAGSLTTVYCSSAEGIRSKVHDMLLVGPSYPLDWVALVCQDKDISSFCIAAASVRLGK